MRTLAPCPGCGRHVAADRRTCPFCDAELGPAPSRAPGLTARLSRAAVLAGAAALSSAAGCGPAATHEVQREDKKVEEKAAAPDAGAAAEVAAPADAAPAQIIEEPIDDWRYRRRNCDKCPYGAPPLPLDRVVA